MATDQAWSRTHKALLSIDNLGAARIREILDAASAKGVHSPKENGFSVGILMLQPSLRTRIGFCEATRRLGGAAFDVNGLVQKMDASAPESLEDTLGVLFGMVDIVVVRTGEPLILSTDRVTVPLINGGDAEEHPTQALVDLFAIRRFCGPIDTLRIGVSGDLTMRTYRSFLKAIRYMPPKELRLMAPPERAGDNSAIEGVLGSLLTYADPGAFEGLDALYLPGLPAWKSGHELTKEKRARYALTTANASRLPATAHIFSPMPVIDEIDPQMRCDPRIRMFQQSDCGIPVRMAILAFALNLG